MKTHAFLATALLSAACGGTPSLGDTAGSTTTATTGVGTGGFGGGDPTSTGTAAGSGGVDSTSTSTSTGGGGLGGDPAGSGGSGAGGEGGETSSGAGGSAGGAPDPSLCPMPSMADIYSGIFPPNPYGPILDATSCVMVEHDVIVLLGCPNEDGGAPSACQIERADMAVALAAAGLGARFITTGGAVHNAFVEADTLAALLVDRGVASSSIWIEPLAQHTDENLYYSTKIMQTEGWTSAIVVSDDPGHLVMTGVCDSNCCVDLGRLTVLTFATSSGDIVAGHYATYPPAAAVTTSECDAIEQPQKFMCVNASSRKACADDFQL